MTRPEQSRILARDIALAELLEQLAREVRDMAPETRHLTSLSVGRTPKALALRPATSSARHCYGSKRLATLLRS